MSMDFIGCHLKTEDPKVAEQAVAALFAEEGFSNLGAYPLNDVLEDADLLPDDEDWVGAVISSAAGTGWVSVYVADWLDSGTLARGLSKRLSIPALELWVAEDTHWGYTLFDEGEVADRFADDPSTVAETAAEQADYQGNAERVSALLHVPITPWEMLLSKAHENAGQFVAEPIDTLSLTLGIPFGHTFTGYDDFFENDPDDYSDDLVNWPAFRHLAFRTPPGREGLTA